MAKFKKEQFFTAEITQLKVDRTLPFNLHIYLQLNDHIILFKAKGEAVGEDLIARLGKYGIKTCYIANEERSAFEAYLKDDSPQNTKASDESEADASEEVETSKEANEESSKEMGPPEEVFQQLVLDQPEAQEQAKEMIKTILKEDAKNQEEFAESHGLLEAIENSDTSSAHSIRVAIYSVLFAMGLGLKDRNVLVDISIAALIHDIGLTQIMPNVISIAQTKRPPALQKHFERHVQKGLEILEELGFKPRPRVLELLEQHHEKFNGTGYPKNLESFKVNDHAQLIAMADLLDSICKGSYNGTIHNVLDAIKLMEEIEKERSFPNYFNPDLFHKILNWVKTTSGEKAIDSASNVVDETKQKVLKAS